MLFRDRQQTVIFAITGVILAGFVLFEYLPRHESIKSVEKARAAQALNIERAQTKKSEISILQGKAEVLKTKVCNYEKQVPRDRNLGDFLQNIADLMNQQKLSGQLIEPEKEIKSGDLQCIPVNMRCSGSLTQLFEFYKMLQKMDRLIRIDQVKLLSKSTVNGEVTMQTRAIIYYQMKAG